MSEHEDAYEFAECAQAYINDLVKADKRIAELEATQEAARKRVNEEYEWWVNRTLARVGQFGSGITSDNAGIVAALLATAALRSKP